MVITDKFPRAEVRLALTSLFTRSKVSSRAAYLRIHFHLPMSDPTHLPFAAASSHEEQSTSADQSTYANCREAPSQSDSRKTLVEQPNISLSQNSLDASRAPIHVARQLQRNSVDPNVALDPRRQACEQSFEKVAPSLTSDTELVSSFNEGIVPQQPVSSEVMGTSKCQLNLSANLKRKDTRDVLSASNEVTNTPFRTLTIDDEEQKRRILGTYLDTRFPEIPDIFMSCQEYIADLDGASRVGHYGSREEMESYPKHGVHNTLENRDGTQTTANAVNDKDDQDAQAYSLHVDMLMSRSMSSDIVNQLGQMPVSSLNAFMDGEDEVEEHTPNAMRCEASYILKGSTKHLANGGLTPRNLEMGATTTGNGRDQAMPDFESANSSDCPLAHRVLLHGESAEQGFEHGCQGAFSLDALLSGGSPRNETAEHVGQSKYNPLTNQFVLSDLTNCQTESQELTVDSLNELLVKVNELGRKMGKQPPSGSANLKYYSLKRMQKDLSENLDISQQLFLTVLKLRQQKANLDEACRKEREEIRRLREILDVHGPAPMKEP